jgi:hypothetical protein
MMRLGFAGDGASQAFANRAARRAFERFLASDLYLDQPSTLAILVTHLFS